MGSDAEVRAFDALGKSARLSDLVAIARQVVFAAAGAREKEWADPTKVARLMTEQSLPREQAMTPFGDALKVLERGPEDDAERALASALFAHVIAESPPKGRDEEDRAASDILWLAAHTPFDATGLLDRALGDAASDLWDAIADRVRRIDQGKLPTLGRGEALVGAVAMTQSTSKAARKHATALASEVRDGKLAHVLAAATAPTGGADVATGEVVDGPRPLWLTALSFWTGLALLRSFVLLFARLALAYQEPAELTLSEAGVRVRYRVILLGRTLSDRTVLFPKGSLARAVRYIRYPRLAFFLGQLMLALGAYFGMGLLVDGTRTSSPTLLLFGLLVVAAGIALDFVLSSVVPGTKGRCTLLLVPAKGPRISLSMDIAAAAGILQRLGPDATITETEAFVPRAREWTAAGAVTLVFLGLMMGFTSPIESLIRKALTALAGNSSVVKEIVNADGAIAHPIALLLVLFIVVGVNVVVIAIGRFQQQLYERIGYTAHAAFVLPRWMRERLSALGGRKPTAL